MSALDGCQHIWSLEPNLEVNRRYTALTFHIKFIMNKFEAVGLHNCKSVQNNRYIYTYTSNHTDANSSLVIVSGRPYTAFALPPSCLASLKLSCSLSNPLPPHLSLSLTNFTSSPYARPPRLLHRTDNPIPKIISTQPNS